MSRRTLIAVCVIIIATTISAMATPKTGCRKFNFTGSFLAPNENFDVFGDGSVLHSFAYQLTIHSDGTADQYWTGLPDYMLNLGTGSHQIGSWTCRDDGKLLITLIQGSYVPTNTVPHPDYSVSDIELVSHSRTTYLFSVDDDNTLTRLQSRTRSYNIHQDPTNPAGGHLQALRTTTSTYTRLVATDADLVAP